MRATSQRISSVAGDKLFDVNPDDVEPNRSNPRKLFPQQQLSKLASSIERRGVLVPISIYENDEKGADARTYVLIDGERRWRCARDLGLRRIPAILVSPKPAKLENLLTMFHIHMVREEWQNMPTAYAVQEISQITGETDPKKLAEMTGIGVMNVRRLQLAVELPKRYRDMIMDGMLPMNFFWELEQNVIEPLRRKRPQVFAGLGDQVIRERMVEKRESGHLQDLIDLRNMARVIAVAAEDAGSPTAPSGLDQAIVDLIQTRERTIQETYEATVRMAVETSKFTQQCQSLLATFDFLEKRAKEPEERALLIEAASQLAAALQARTARASSA